MGWYVCAYLERFLGIPLPSLEVTFVEVMAGASCPR
jgi:hypothetical protein